MADMVKRFQELSPELHTLAGGKGSMLAKMFQQGYPVPDGFVVLPGAFAADQLDAQAWQETRAALAALRENEPAALFAVRSSAVGEDSGQSSYAGAFETVLNVQSDEDIRAAIAQVFRSGQGERVRAYSAMHGLDPSGQVAVVVQRMVAAEFSGVLFTADPVSGSYASMVGNFVRGLGDQLVSGEVDAESFQLSRPKGIYTGPPALKKAAARLYQYAARLERQQGCPQDIEWAVAGGKLYLLQSRPVTSLSAGSLDTYQINYSLTGDALWTSTNVAEAIPDVFSPFTWSIGSQLDQELNFIPGYYVWSGNICGRAYMNISRRVSVIAAVTGKDAKSALKLLGGLYGQIPDGMHMPLHPFGRFELLKVMLPRVFNVSRNTLKAGRGLPKFLAETPEWCRAMRARIAAAATQAELLALWKNELQPYTFRAWWSAAAGGSQLVAIMQLEQKLEKLAGPEDARTLLSNLRGGAELASLGPLLGISRVAQGHMTPADYWDHYGHRGPHEYELSLPDPAEVDGWLEEQAQAARQSGAGVEVLLAKQQAQYRDALRRFEQRYPKKIKWLEKQIEQAAAGARQREASRSEFVRVFRLIRAFARRAGALAGIGDDVFFLYIADVEALLAGDRSSLRWVEARRANYEQYKALPPFPAHIRGRFDPFEWAKDPNRRHDYYDATQPAAVDPQANILTGYAGAAGRVEGVARVLTGPEQGDQLLPGEILVATTTNIGWTPLFLKAAAIITDIGAPLSHAAIVARELGIPAIVGCGSATTRIHTGDRVRVDGAQGTVTLLP